MKKWIGGKEKTIFVTRTRLF